MAKNMGTSDRIIRAIVGAGGVAVGVAFGGWFWIPAAIGGVFLATAIFGFCPIYAVLKLTTRSKTASR